MSAFFFFFLLVTLYRVCFRVLLAISLSLALLIYDFLVTFSLTRN